MNSLKDYRLRAEDEAGNLTPEFLLQHMIESYADFTIKVLQLEYVGHSFDVRVMITTNYYAECTSEGIEYSWNFLKSLCYRHPLSAKKGQGKFDALVVKCTSCNLVTVAMVRKFSKRERGHMLAYRALECDELKKSPDELTHITRHIIEKM